jgi:hypothetical protein
MLLRKSSLKFRYSLTRHAKRVTLKVEDMRLLRQLWKVIDPQAHIGKDTPENTELKSVAAKLHEAKVEREKERMREKVRRLRRSGAMSQLTAGEGNFLRGHLNDLPLD